MRKKIKYEGWFDGSYRKENGIYVMGIGAFLEKDDKLIFSASEVLNAEGSSNAAEYLALIKLLEYIASENITDHITIRGDSRLVINQMIGRWGIKEGIYVEYAHKAKALIKAHNKISLRWTPRTSNGKADSLSKQH